MSNGVMNTPSAGSAPFDEVGKLYDTRTAQRDDGEATEPERAIQRQRNQASQIQVSDGFAFGPDGRIAPTKGLVASLTEMAREVYDDREAREAQLKVDPALIRGLTKVTKKFKEAQEYLPIFNLAKQIVKEKADVKKELTLDEIKKELDLCVSRLEKVSDFMGMNFIRAVARQAAQEFAMNLYWADIHNNNVRIRADQGNEAGAEDSLLMFESSRNQMLIAAQIMDWAGEQEMQNIPDVQRGVVDALNLRAWSQMNQSSSANRQQRHQNTVQNLFGREADEFKDDSPDDIV